MAVTALAIVVFSLPSSLEHYRTVCFAALEVCSERAVGQVTTEGVRELRDGGLSLRSYALFNVVVDKVFQLAWFAVGTLIFWRRSDDWMALLTSIFLVTFGTVAVDPANANALASSQPAWWLPVRGVQVVGVVCSTLFFLLFPSGRFVPRWTRWLALTFIMFEVPRTLSPGFYYGAPAIESVSKWVFIGFVVSLVWSQIHRYRRYSSEAQRRQTKWVVFGATIAVAGTFPFRVPLDFSLVGGDAPLVLLVFEVGFAVSFLFLPLSLGVAVLRSQLFDIDVVINRTLVYGSLTAFVGLLYFGGVTATQAAFQALTGQERLPQLTIVASTLLIAALVNPLRRRIQMFVDRRFYRGKYDARKTLVAFAARLRAETALEKLSKDLVGVVTESMQPAHASLWLRQAPDRRAKEEPES